MVGDACQRQLQRRQPRALQQGVVAADARQQRLVRAEREHARQRHLQRRRDRFALALDLRGDVVGRAQLVPQRIDLVQHHERARATRFADVLVPQFKIAARDSGVGAEQEQHGLRAGNQRQRQFGLGAQRVQPRRVEHAQALREQFVLDVEQRVAPARHVDAAVGGTRSVVVDREAQRASPLGVDAHGVGEVGQRGLQRRRVDAAQLGPGVGAALPLRQRRGVGPAGYRQQAQRRRVLRRRRSDLQRAHRRAPGSGRQHAPAVSGEEDRVDQLGLAARELGDEGQLDDVAAQALIELGQRFAPQRVVDARVAQPVQQRGQMRQPLRAPAAEVDPACRVRPGPGGGGGVVHRRGGFGIAARGADRVSGVGNARRNRCCAAPA
ncbi:hypothetical protein GALL_417860 [mine drainage metagenome]|uniref:Uncharacterized protein n=1 Tax=mine drainage metagenome TaxID=410659 RepID=A0A1J5Q9H4_9ZZZZ